MSQKDQLHNNDKTTTEHRLSAAAFDNSSNTFQQAHPAAIIQRAMSDPGSLSPHDVLQLQRSIGNQAVAGLLMAATRGIQHSPIQMKAVDDEEDIQLKSDPLNKTPKIENSSLQKNTNNTGMPEDIQAKMESALNTGFSGVKIHPNSQKATDLGALAYTQGNDIYFAPGKYEPGSRAGQELLGHELAHVVQQREGRVKTTLQMQGVSINDDPALEKEADIQGQAAAAHQLKAEDAKPLIGSGEANTSTPSPALEEALQLKAGVDLFEVKWKKNTNSGPTVAKLRLDYKAKFKNDQDHNPAHAEFRQNVKSVTKVTEGPHDGFVDEDAQMIDDNYSRADDTAGHTINDVDFESNDNPGASNLDANDKLDYSFTAEQMIIDTSDGNKVIAKRGPHTATIKGKDPRVYDNALPFTAT